MSQNRTAPAVLAPPAVLSVLILDRAYCLASFRSFFRPRPHAFAPLFSFSNCFLHVQDIYPEPISIEHHHPDHSVDPDALKTLIRHVVNAEGGRLRYIGIVLAGHETVTRLNREYLDHDYDTDVLAFSLADPEADDDRDGDSDSSRSVVEGEVYVDLDTAEERHQEFDATFEEEARRYVVHGVLHLLGYRDSTESGNDEMHRLEDRYLGEVSSTR